MFKFLDCILESKKNYKNHDFFDGTYDIIADIELIFKLKSVLNR